MAEITKSLSGAFAPILVQAVLRDPALQRVHFKIGQPSAADLMQMRLAVLAHANYRHCDAKAIEKYDGVG